MDVWANFVPNPLGLVTGSYAGFFSDPQGADPTNSGSFTATVSGLGKFSAKLQLAQATYALAGFFSPSGTYSKSIARAGATPLSIQLQLDLAAKQSLTGWVSGGTWQSALTAYRGIYTAASPAPQAGKKYTLVIPGSTNSATAPGGYGFGTVSVSSLGAVSFSGTLGDGTKVTKTTLVSSQGQWPLCLSLYSGKGLLLGWMTFTNASDQDLAGQVAWVKSVPPASEPYPDGFAFNDGLEVTGSLYAYTNGTSVLGWTDGVIQLEGGNLAQPVVNGLAIKSNNTVTGTNKLSLTITTASGLFQGSVVNPATGKTISVSGVLLQDAKAGYGCFLGGNESGSVYLEPAP
jgi:hypothetical protein